MCVCVMSLSSIYSVKSIFLHTHNERGGGGAAHTSSLLVQAIRWWVFDLILSLANKRRMRYETGDDSAAAADVDEIGRRRSWVCVCVFNSKTAAHHALSIFIYVFDVVFVVVAASGAWVLSCTDVYRRRRVYHDIRVFAVMVFFYDGWRISVCVVQWMA